MENLRVIKKKKKTLNVPEGVSAALGLALEDKGLLRPLLVTCFSSLQGQITRILRNTGLMASRQPRERR